MALSKKSEDFLDNLRIFLFASGKNDREVNEIVGELEDHLILAEKNGKTVDDVIGESPKEYMKQIAGEMGNDYKTWMKYIPMIILGVFSYVILGDDARGGIHYTYMELFGYPVVTLFLLLLSLAFYKFMASHQFSKSKAIMLYALLSVISVGSYLCILLLKNAFGQAVVNFGVAGNITAAAISYLFLIGISIWSKTWFSILIPVMLYLPELIFNFTSFSEEAKSIAPSAVSFLLVVIYLLYTMRKLNREKVKVND